MTSGKDMLIAFKKRWQLMQALEIFLYAIGPATLAYLLKPSATLTIAVFLAVAIVVMVVRKPWGLTLKKIGGYIDENLTEAEYSTGLLLLSETELTNLARLQRHEVSQLLRRNVGQVKPHVPLKRAIFVFGVFALLTLFAYQSGWRVNLGKTQENPTHQEAVVFKTLDSTRLKEIPPSLVTQKLEIQYPSYTKIPPVLTSDMNIKALEGSRLTWQLTFDKPVEAVLLESSNKTHSMNKKEGYYMRQMTLNASGFYNFRFEDMNGGSHQSELFAMEVFKDEPPLVEIQNLKQFTSFDFAEEKIVTFETRLTDDYGIMDAHIIATVSKGEGESVKFREEHLLFNTSIKKGHKTQKLSKSIDLDELGMEPGDELYFYVGVTDNREPKSNTTRSETYFVTIRDTLSNQFAVEGTMGADLMPDYFRSQRQLIIDTEKLIANRSKVPKKEFNFTSNELGFDQKALRLKYGKFMGDEAESSIQVTEEVTEEIKSAENNEDPLSEYTHDHDGNNEHNLVDHDHDHEEEGEGDKAEDPLESYLHNHDDPEESTLFTQSLKSKLRQAMSEMWDAELYLRLYTPEESLPYQYRALKLIQEIKNSARIYVHRIGFDPPPIKEDKRLTGELDEVISFQKQEDLTVPDEFLFMRKAVERLEQLMQGQAFKEVDKDLFAQAGNELAELAILEPGKYLNALQHLKWMSDSREVITDNQLHETLKGLLEAIPKPRARPESQTGHTSELNALLLKELEIND